MKLTSFVFVGMLTGSGLLAAQDHDLAFLFGFSQRDASIRNDVIKGQVRVSVQGNYGRRILEGDAGRIYFEVPVMAAAGLDGQIDNTVTGRAGGIVFVTPGLRFHVNLGSAVSVYVAGGAGGAFSRERIGTPAGAGVTNKSHTSGAANYGGGLDFRLGRNWSLRLEARDFRVRREARIPGRNTVFQVGFARRF